MRKITLLFLFSILFSCGVKQTKSMLTSGDYDGAIANAVSNLRTSKEKKGKQDYVYLLEEAFAKAKERDLRMANDLSKDGNPANLERIYSTYVQLDKRQELIRPLLPQCLRACPIRRSRKRLPARRSIGKAISRFNPKIPIGH